MAAVTKVTLTCDVCGSATGVQTRAFGLDGKTYEVDLCPKDSSALSKAAAGYVSKARPGRAGPRPRAGERKPRSRAADATGSRQETGVFVYGIFPADIEVAAEMPGVGENPGLIRAVRAGDLAALVSDVHLSGRLGSPADVRMHRKKLDASVRGVPVLALPFGTVLPSDEAVVQELLTPQHDEFADALQELEGRAQFVVQGRYLEESAAGRRSEYTGTLREAMAGQCVASHVRQPADEQDAVHVAFLVDLDQEPAVQRVVEGLAREWDGRIQLRLLGPMAAYDFGPAMEVDR